MKKIICMVLALVIMVSIATTAFAGDCGNAPQAVETTAAGSLKHILAMPDENITLYESEGRVDSFRVGERSCENARKYLDWEYYGEPARLTQHMYKDQTQKAVLDINGIKVQLSFQGDIAVLKIGKKTLKSVKNSDNSVYNGFTYFAQDEFMPFVEKNLKIAYPESQQCPYGRVSISRLIVWLGGLTEDHNYAEILVDFMVKYPCDPVLVDYIRIEFDGQVDTNGNQRVAHTGNSTWMYTVAVTDDTLATTHNAIVQDFKADRNPIVSTRINYDFYTNGN